MSRVFMLVFRHNISDKKKHTAKTKKEKNDFAN